MLDHELLSAYAQTLAKSKDLLLGRVAPYDLSGDLAFMEMASRHDSTQYRGKTTDQIFEESDTYSGMLRGSAIKQDTIHLQLDNLEEEE